VRVLAWVPGPVAPRAGWVLNRSPSGTVVSAPPDAVVEGAEQAWLVEDRPQWDGFDGGADPVPGYKQISFLYRVDTISREDFASRWAAHSALARVHHPMLWRYAQNIVVRPLLPGTPDIDGIAELTMRLRLDFTERMYGSAEGRRIIGEDTRAFIDRSRGWRVMAREYRTAGDLFGGA
jgi:EthD domain-containing protein